MSKEKNREETTAARRRLIIESAALCFVEKGFHQTSVREIAVKAGISLGNLYNHFESKAELIAEIASLEAEEMLGIEMVLNGEGEPNKLIEKFIAAFFDYISEPLNTVLAAEISAEVLRNENVARGFEQNRKRVIKLLVSVLKEGQKQKIFKMKSKPSEMANLVIDLVQGSAMRVAFHSKRQKAQTRKTVSEAVRKLLE